MFKTRSMKTAGTAASEIQRLMFPFSKGPDDTHTTAATKERDSGHCCSQLQLRDPSDRKDDSAGTYTTGVSPGTPAPSLLSERDPFAPSNHQHPAQMKGAAQGGHGRRFRTTLESPA